MNNPSVCVCVCVHTHLGVIGEDVREDVGRRDDRQLVRERCTALGSAAVKHQGKAVKGTERR